jgi:hypothetical protein
MGAALGLAVLLVAVVAVLSVGLNSQRTPFQAVHARRAADARSAPMAGGASDPEQGFELSDPAGGAYPSAPDSDPSGPNQSGGANRPRAARHPSSEHPSSEHPRSEHPRPEQRDEPLSEASSQQGRAGAGLPEVAETGGPQAQGMAPEPDLPTVTADAKPLRSQATARVMSVVDERQLGPVTKSRLTLRVEPDGADSFEVVARVAFSSPEERSRVKVGSTVPVRYDAEDHRRVVVEVARGDG